MKRFWMFFIVAGLLFMVCGKKAVIRKYYILETPRPIKMADSVETVCLPIHVDIRDFQISKAINQTRIALKTKSHELNYYFYHHWAVRPSIGTADMVYQITAYQKCFRRLVRGYSSQPDYFITGNIQNLERDETGKKVAVHFAATLELIDAESNIPLIRHTFDRTEHYTNPKSMNSFAETISLILYQETTAFLNIISDYFKKHSEAATQ
ncbi:membrane integrity-associated transporter subunit PqiC [bacterium]|nr:membrane integrity-associated transporter subunit PqiC [bacterium]